MQPDEPVNHTSYTFGEDPHEQDRKKNAVLQQVPLLAEVLKHIDNRIAELMSPETYGDDILTDPVKHMHADAGRKIGLKELRYEKAYIQSKINALPSDQ